MFDLNIADARSALDTRDKYKKNVISTEAKRILYSLPADPVTGRLLVLYQRTITKDCRNIFFIYTSF